jgi:hypothetical protein
MMCIPYMSNYYLCNFFLKNIDNKKLKKIDGAYDNVYIMYVKRYAIKIYSRLVS